MIKQFIAIALVAVFAVGCRAVTSKSSVSNTFTAKGNIILKGSGTEGLQEGTQAADKKLGDISPSTKVSAQ